MPMTSVKFVPHEMKSSLIKVFSYEGKNLRGVLINPYYGKEMFFTNTTQLLFLVDDVMSDLNYPQENMESRSFSKESGRGNRAVFAEEPQEKMQEIANFKINVLFRQNASWQGTLVWLDRAIEAQFRSVLELLILIDSVLSAL